MTAYNRVAETLFGLIFIAVIFGAIVGGIQIGREARSGYASVEEDQKFVRDRIHATSCADWKNFNIWERYVIHRELSWCADYGK